PRLPARAWLAPHEPGGLPVEAEREAERGVDDEVDPQHLPGVERLAVGDIEQAGAEERQDEDNQQDKYETDVLGEVVVDLAALLHREDDRGEVVVGQDHPAGVLGYLGAGA